VARDEWPWGIRLGIGFRRMHPPLSRIAGRRPARKAGPHGHAQPFRRRNRVTFSGEELNEEHLDLHSAEFLTEFRLEAGMPTWRYDIRGSIIEKGLLMPHLQNTAYISYRNLCDRV